ncbi:MAG: sulfate permease [Planctomycetota bacterium]|nr:MAG: sulfate permease [Planctomycetota bacterium]
MFLISNLLYILNTAQRKHIIPKVDKEPEIKSLPADECQGWCFNRNEFAGSLGDLGTLLPIAIGLILINGMDATAVLLCVGLYYVLSGLYFRTTVPVQPMKVIGAYAIARAVTPVQITTAGFCVGIILLILAVTGAMKLIGRIVPKPTVRGVQLTTGILLLTKGIDFMLGKTALQSGPVGGEPFLSVQSLGPIPIGILLGTIAVVLILLLIENRKVPAAIVVIGFGIAAGLALGAYKNLAGFDIGFHYPKLLPHGWPVRIDLAVAIFVLALPQIPMTVGNAIIAQADLTKEYFGAKVGKRMSLRALAVSMGLANVAASLLGGMPMCHGAGGLAAHYRFGARTVGSNLMIGAIFLIVALLIGDKAVALFSLIPFSVLGALLVFAGAQLAMMILDVEDRKNMFVVVAMLGVALATNLAIGFGVGIILAYAFKYTKMKI